MSSFKNFIRFFFMLFYSKILYFKRKVKVDSTVFLNKKTNLEGRNVIHYKTNICGASIGYATYIGRNGFFMDTTIGKFCSIGTNVKILPYTHPTAVYVSTHPSFFSVLKQSGFTFAKNQTFNEVLYYNEQENISVKISETSKSGIWDVFFTGFMRREVNLSAPLEFVLTCSVDGSWVSRFPISGVEEALDRISLRGVIGVIQVNHPDKDSVERCINAIQLAKK